MANMNFGVNLLPKQDNTYSLGNSDKKWNLYVNTINGETLDELIPEMVGATSGSDGSGGMVPAPTDSDTDKFLRGNGTWSEPNVNVWDEMTLNRTEATFPLDDVYVIGGTFLNSDNRVQYKVSDTPAAGVIPKYDASQFLKANTPPRGDNTNKVATTSFVSTALGGIAGIQINKSATLPLQNVTLNDGYEIYPIQQMILSIEHTQNLNGQIQPWIGGSYINLVNVTDFTATETTVKTIGTLAANTYILSFYVNSTTTVGENETAAGGSAIIKAGDTVLDTLTISANNNERQIYNFTLESSATITLTITSADTTYSYVISNIQVETNTQVSNYTPYENLCPITAGYTQCEILHRAKNLWDNTSPIRVPGYYNNDGTFTQAENWRPISISCVEDDVITIYGSHFKDIVTLWNDNTFVDYTTNTTITIPEGVNKIIVCGLNTTAEDQIYCNEHTYTYEFPQAAGTVYGGQLTLTPDGASVLTSNFNIGNLSSLTWTYDSTNDVFVANCFVDQKLPASNMFKGVAYCSNLPVIAASSVLVGSLGLGITSDGKYYVHYRGMDTDATAFTTAMTGQTIYYETATTSTYNMSSLEVITLFPGYNSFTCSTGRIRRIDYVANVTGLINTADKLKIDALDLDEQASINLSKADKVSGATNGNFAALNASGNLVDSGHKHSDYLTQHQDISGKANSADLAAVATSGDYDDLSNTPEEINPYKVVSTPADVVTITDGADSLPVKQLKVAVEPVQDLHGYDNPWPAGGGKNLFNVTATTQMVNGVTFTVNADGTITASNTATANISIVIGSVTLPAGSYILNGGLKNYNTVLIQGVAESNGSDASFTVAQETTYDVRIYVLSGQTPGGTFKPMIRLSSVSDATFAPYSNICPISGWTGANVTRAGKNFAGTKITDRFPSGNPPTAAVIDMTGVIVYEAYIKQGGNYTITAYGGDRFGVYVSDKPISEYASQETISLLYAHSREGSEVTKYSYTLNNVSDNKYIGVYASSTSGGDSVVMIEKGSAESAYEQYSGATYPIAFPAAAGTVYGGTLTVNEDGTGTLVVDRKTYSINSSSGFYDHTGRWYYNGLPSDFNNDASIRNKSISNSRKNYAGVLTTGPYFAYGSTGLYLWKLKTEETIEDLNTMLSENPLQIVYYLTTSITYTLTPGQVKTLLGLNNLWADTGKINRLEYPYETTGLIGTYDKVKLDLLPSSILSGINLASTALTPVNGIVTIPLMTGCDASNNGAAGAVPAPSSGDQNKFLAGDGTWKDGGKPMVILSYGNSTWNDFITAYNNNIIVYCRASSNSNPGSGSQTRMAFMAYVNNADTPTNVEFQYYRSVNTHSATQMGDQVFVYKLDKNSGWSVTTRDASIKEINVASGSKLGVSWSSNKVTLSNTMTANDMPMSSSDATTTKAAIEAIDGNFNPLIQTITPSSGVTVDCGGYYQLGKIVIVFLRLQLSSDVTADTVLFTGLPGYNTKSHGFNSVILASNKAPISARHNGDAACTAAVTAGAIIISGIYVCD